MNILVLGGGGREHALTWRLACDAGVSRIFCAPGNAGIAQVAVTVPLDPANPADVLAFVEEHDIALTVVGPELPLTRGVVDLLSARGRLAFGPTRAAAEIESSKVFAKEFMVRHRVPTADCEVCSSADAARRVVASGRFGFPLVVKADGLAAGKGVIIAEDRTVAFGAIDAIMVGRQFGEAGERVLIEECLAGPEVSFFVVSDGVRGLSFCSAQDHKRAYDDDRGPNTGGMGAFAPSPLVDAALAARIIDEVVTPTIDGMRAEGRPFRGFLYVGLMLTSGGPKVLEFNARLGDPEAQVLLPLLAEDLMPLLHDAAAGTLSRSSAVFASGATVGVVLASGGYPDRYETRKPIAGLDEAAAAPGVLVFHAGTAIQGDQVVTSGGRVLTIVGRGPDYGSAIARAYEAVGRIAFEGMHWRRDIGAKAPGGARQGAPRDSQAAGEQP
jgi:phosphoribosylamine--glycine ligase